MSDHRVIAIVAVLSILTAGALLARIVTVVSARRDRRIANQPLAAAVHIVPDVTPGAYSSRRLSGKQRASIFRCGSCRALVLEDDLRAHFDEHDRRFDEDDFPTFSIGPSA